MKIKITILLLITQILFSKTIIQDTIKNKLSTYDIDTLITLAKKSEEKFVYQSSQIYYKLAFVKLLNKFNNNKIKLLKMQDTSMSPILEKGDEFISIKTNNVKRGDLIIFKKPNSEIYDIKRCIALPKDLIAMRNKTIFLHPYEGNKFVLDNNSKENILKVAGKLWIKNPYKSQFKSIRDDNNISSKTKIPTHKITNGKYFVLGDNRDHSQDSKDFGMVDGKEIYRPLLIVGNKNNPKRQGMLIKNNF